MNDYTKGAFFMGACLFGAASWLEWVLKPAWMGDGLATLYALVSLCLAIASIWPWRDDDE